MYQTLENFLVKTSGLELAKDNSIKTLMLLHGWGMNSQVWEPIRPRLESRYHLLWVDLPGHGVNRHIEVSNLEQMLTLVAELTPANTHLMAWSLGGLVAQALTQQIPERIKSMTLVASTPKFSQGVDGDWQYAMSTDVLMRFAENLKQDTLKTLKGFIALQFIGVKDAKQQQDNLINHILYGSHKKTAQKWGGVLLKDDSESVSSTTYAQKTDSANIPSQEALDVGLAILQHTDLRNHQAVCPEHWIFAEYDRLIPKDVINDLISLRPDAEITLLEKAGHAPFITHPDRFLQKAISFIDAH